jgi:hypothetical protein
LPRLDGFAPLATSWLASGSTGGSGGPIVAMDAARVSTTSHEANHANRASPVVPFLAGAALGTVAGVVAGTLFSRHAVHLIAALIGAVDRRLTREEREQLPFELLLQ